jgi:hypothetical protein
VDGGGLWFRVLAAQYGVEQGRLREGGGSVWWREIERIMDGVGGLRGGWFWKCVTSRVGDGSETFFWSDPWLGGIPVSERFGRLVNKLSTVAKMWSLGVRVWRGGVGVAETVVGVGRGDVEGVSYFTSSCFGAGGLP